MCGRGLLPGFSLPSSHTLLAVLLLLATSAGLLWFLAVGESRPKSAVPGQEVDSVVDDRDDVQSITWCFEVL